MKVFKKSLPINPIYVLYWCWHLSLSFLIQVEIFPVSWYDHFYCILDILGILGSGLRSRSIFFHVAIVVTSLCWGDMVQVGVDIQLLTGPPTTKGEGRGGGQTSTVLFCLFLSHCHWCSGSSAPYSIPPAPS